jgi:3-hydroxybutyryl-CoA dehydratase
MREVSQNMINSYAGVSGDFNPLHVDAEFARKSRFGGTIAHGHIAVSWLCEMLTRWQGAAFLHGGRLEDVRFISPIRPGDKIEVGGEITDVTQDRVCCEVWVENQKGERCVTGKASMPLSVKMR